MSPILICFFVHHGAAGSLHISDNRSMAGWLFLKAASGTHPRLLNVVWLRGFGLAEERIRRAHTGTRTARQADRQAGRQTAQKATETAGAEFEGRRETPHTQATITYLPVERTVLARAATGDSFYLGYAHQLGQ